MGEIYPTPCSARAQAILAEVRSRWGYTAEAEARRRLERAEASVAMTGAQVGQGDAASAQSSGSNSVLLAVPGQKSEAFTARMDWQATSFSEKDWEACAVRHGRRYPAHSAGHVQGRAQGRPAIRRAAQRERRPWRPMPHWPVPQTQTWSSAARTNPHGWELLLRLPGSKSSPRHS